MEFLRLLASGKQTRGSCTDFLLLKLLTSETMSSSGLVFLTKL